MQRPCQVSILSSDVVKVLLVLCLGAGRNVAFKFYSDQSGEKTTIMGEMTNGIFK